MAINIVKTIKGPCVIRYKQADFFSQDDVTVEFSPTLFEVQSSAYGPVDSRVDDQLAQSQFTPMGVWGSEILGIYNSVANKKLNDWMADNWRVSAVDAATNDDLAIAATIPDGTPVRIFALDGAVPAGVDEDTLYYTNERATGFYTLHATQAAAIAGTGVIDLTDAGSGKITLIEQQPVRIQELNTGDYLDLHNAVVSQLPGITFGATVQLFGQMQLRAFPKFGVARATADSVYSEGNAAVTASLNPAGVITQPYTFSWGAAPWDALEAKEGISMTFNMTLNDDTADSIGVGMLSLGNLAVQVQAQPAAEITQAALLAKMKVQGAGAVRGASLAGDDLDISGAGVFARLYNAALIAAPLAWGPTVNRVGSLTWQATRTVTAGVADPLFLLATAAP